MTGVPAPPPGPGVAPPFVAPPTDRSRARMWIGLGVGGVLALLCCVGGLVGAGLLLTGTSEQAKRLATETVTVYLNALQERDFATAQAQYCRSLREQVSREQLAAQARREPFSEFTLDEPVLADSIEVTAHLTTGSGQVDRLFLLETEGQAVKICAIR